MSDEAPREVLIGRTRELDAIVAGASVPGAIVTIVGPPGIGKSALERAASERLRELGARTEVHDDADDELGELRKRIEATRRRGARRASRSAGSLLLSARRCLGVDGEIVVRLGPLEPADARELLLAASGLKDETDAALAIVLGLGCEPLPIVVAAFHARALGLSGLLDRLRDPVSFFRSSAARLRDPVDAAWRRLSKEGRGVLAAAAYADASFTLEVLERVVARGDILDAAEELLACSLFTRSHAAGVVRLAVPWTVRHVVRQRDTTPTLAARRPREVPDGGWLAAWATRAAELEPSSYGPEAPAVLSELSCAVPVAVRGLASSIAEERLVALDLWTKLEGAVFFEGALDFRDPAFERFVAVADTDHAAPWARARSRVIAARAKLEMGDVARADALYAEADGLVDGADALKVAVLRGRGWAALADGRIEDARVGFAGALRLADSCGDMRGQADAHAGLGMTALLGGEPERARDSLRASLAIHTVMGDVRRAASVTGMMELVSSPGATATSGADVASLRAEVDAYRSKGQRWREAIVLARLSRIEEERGDRESAARLLHEAKVASRLASMPAAPKAEAIVAGAPALPPLRIAKGGRWIELPSGERHDLSRHGALKRALWALALARRDRPGAGLAPSELLNAAWPSEKMNYEAGMLRVYTTVRRLRALGLAEALITRDDGYLLDVSVALSIED